MLLLFALLLPAAAGSDADTDIGETEGRALLQIIRAKAARDPSYMPIGPALDRADSRTLIVTFYRRIHAEDPGRQPGFHYAGARDSLRQAAEEAGDKLAALLAKLPKGADALRAGILQVDVVIQREPIKARGRLAALRHFEFGVDGLACRSGERTFCFTPTTIMRHAKELDIIKAAFIAQESIGPPRRLRSERIRTVSFVEEKPGGRALRVVRANTRRARPHAFEMVEACSMGGLWLLRTQQQDGSFLPPYYPAVEKADPLSRYGLADHMRAALVVTQLYLLTDDEQFLTAQKRALKYAGRFMDTRHRLSLAYLRSEKKDEITATALMLTTLCTLELRRPNPTADLLMRYLGEYLCALTDEDGWLYSSLAHESENRPVRIVQGSPYAEVLTALCMLERISPKERVRRSINRLLKLVTSFRSAAPPPGPRTIEAVAEAYRLKCEERLGNIAVELGFLLAKTQITPEKTDAPDLLGGFPEPKVAPQTFTTAQATSGLAAAYQIGKYLRRKDTSLFSTPVRDGAHFLLHMQFRPENTFYLRHHKVILGGFRKSAADLTLQVGPTAEAIRSLIAAATVTAETIPPEVPERKKDAQNH